MTDLPTGGYAFPPNMTERDWADLRSAIRFSSRYPRALEVAALKHAALDHTAFYELARKGEERVLRDLIEDAMMYGQGALDHMAWANAFLSGMDCAFADADPQDTFIKNLHRAMMGVAVNSPTCDGCKKHKIDVEDNGEGLYCYACRQLGPPEKH